ncbi:MAG: PAAR domain-containing protein [Phycisphaerae bacterium]
MSGSNPGADYPWDPAVQEQMIEDGIPIPPEPTPPAPAPPAPGGGFPAARLGDLTTHFGVIGPAVAAMTVLIGYMPAATMGDPHVCPMFNGPQPHVGGTIAKGSMTVIIGGKPAARVNDPIVCPGPPGTIAPPGCPTVFIGG